MLLDVGNATQITTLFNDEILTLSESADWSVWMKDVRDISDNTIYIYMKAMERFWIWSLYNPVRIDESFPSFQARYRKSLRSGFEITVNEYSDKYQDEVEVKVCSCTPLSKVTINKELAGINSYFYFTEEMKMIEDHRFINKLYEKQREAKSFLSSVGVKPSSVALETHGKKVSYMPPYKLGKNRQKIKYFPLELFDEFLEMAAPRERLIYLLCGASSARIGQALNLTLYDIDYDRQEVWLLDPKSDDKDIYGNKRVVWLKKEYGIDMNTKNIHNKPDLQFKYPIPASYEPLFWMNDKYKEMFFRTLTEYTKSETFVSETVRYPRHPFVFTTKTGKRVGARDTLSRLKTILRKLSAKHTGYDWINGLGLHSLRHFFGHYMAEIYARTGEEAIISITREAMGHSNPESTFIYFNISRETQRVLLKNLSEEIYGKGY